MMRREPHSTRRPIGVTSLGRTALGQAVYDILISRMSAAEAAKRHPDFLTREEILMLRRAYPEFRPHQRTR